MDPVSFELPMAIITLILIGIGLRAYFEKNEPFSKAAKNWRLVFVFLIVACVIVLLPLLRIVTYAMPFMLLLLVVYGFVFFILHPFKSPEQIWEDDKFKKIFVYSFAIVFVVVASMSAGTFLGPQLLALNSPTGSAARSPAMDAMTNPNVLYLGIFLIMSVLLYVTVIRKM